MMIETIRMMKILMDGQNSISIPYKDAFDKLVDPRKLHALKSPFHGVVLGWRVMTLGTIILQDTFSDEVHYRKETLSFEFEGPCHAILRRSGYAKFMAVSKLAYIKLRMTGPYGIITEARKSAYECDRVAIEHDNHTLHPEEHRLNYKLQHRLGTGGPKASASRTEAQANANDPKGCTTYPILIVGFISTTNVHTQRQIEEGTTRGEGWWQDHQHLQELGSSIGGCACRLSHQKSRYLCMDAL
jgi:hypothetical protein